MPSSGGSGLAGGSQGAESAPTRAAAVEAGAGAAECSGAAALPDEREALQAEPRAPSADNALEPADNAARPLGDAALEAPSAGEAAQPAENAAPAAGSQSPPQAAPALPGAGGPAPGESAGGAAASADPILPEYAPCELKRSGSGSGSFGIFTGRYANHNICIVEFSFEGALGRVDIENTRAKAASRNVAYVDFFGSFSAERSEFRGGFGPVANMKTGRRRGFARLSFNFLDDLAPGSASAELFCRPGHLAAKVAMDADDWRENGEAAGL